MRSPNGVADVNSRLAALDEALELAAPRLDAEVLADAYAVRDKAGERLARGDEVVVVAFAGGTGTGKSSLFNAVTGRQLSEVGVRRPVTSEVLAWSVGEPQASTGVLDWLGVRRRFSAEPDVQMPEGLVLLDLPDHDSVEAHHREVSERFVERVDVLVWVVDPLKYAQRSLHDGQLGQLVHHADVQVVVLNQVDRLTAAERKACLADLRRILAEEGLGRARVLATSATTGEGVADLRGLLADEARRRRAVTTRLSADVRGVALALRTETGSPVGTKLDGGRLVDALGQASGVGALGDAARARYLAAARRSTRPLVTRLLWGLLALVASPFRSLVGPRPLRLPTATDGDDRPVRPDPSPAAVRHALARLVEDQGASLPQRWRAHLRDVVAQLGEELPTAVGRATDRVGLSPGRRGWWTVVALIWTLVELVALAGLGWLVTLAVIAWLQLPALPVPDAIGELPWPTALLIGGGALWLVLALVRGRLVRLGAARHRRRTVRELREAVTEVAEQGAIQRVRGELAAHDALATALQRAAQ